MHTCIRNSYVCSPVQNANKDSQDGEGGGGGGDQRNRKAAVSINQKRYFVDLNISFFGLKYTLKYLKVLFGRNRL
jgi:hypothetical protein